MTEPLAKISPVAQNAVMASRYLVTMEKHMDLREKENKDIVKLAHEVELQEPNVDKELNKTLFEKVTKSAFADYTFIHAQIERYQKYFFETAARLVALGKKQAEQAKNGN